LKPFRLVALLLIAAGVTLIFACGSTEETTNAYTKARPAADEAAALLTLRVIAGAQQSYFVRHGAYGTFDQLADAGVIDGRFRGAAPAVNGYIYTMAVTQASAATSPAFSVNADPQANADRAPAGTRHYFMDAGGTIHYNDTQAATAGDPAPQ
jgi:hypothetical protein